MNASRQRDASEYLLPGVIATINALDLEPEDEAMVKLAKHYARTIDAAVKPEYATRWIGPQLQTVLESLGASPAARARQKTGTQPDVTPEPIRQLRSVTT